MALFGVLKLSRSDTYVAALSVLAVHTAQAIDRANLFAEARASQRRAEEQRQAAARLRRRAAASRTSCAPCPASTWMRTGASACAAVRVCSC